MNGDQLVPEEIVRDITNGGTELNKIQMKRAGYNEGSFDAYRNQVWVREVGKKYTQIGVFGQFCYIDIEKDLVIVKFGSYRNTFSPTFMDQMDFIASYFEKSPGKKKSKTKKVDLKLLIEVR